jgi:hypothetical protein
MILRMRKKQNPFLGSKDHFALRMEAMGLTRPQILALATGAAALLALAAFVVTQVDLGWAVAIYAIVGLEIMMLSWQLSKVHVH